jgi:hypothetical protein
MVEQSAVNQTVAGEGLTGSSTPACGARIFYHGEWRNLAQRACLGSRRLWVQIPPRRLESIVMILIGLEERREQKPRTEERGNLLLSSLAPLARFELW